MSPSTVLFLALSLFLVAMIAVSLYFSKSHVSQSDVATLRSGEKKLQDAAAREFEGAKPALIHACDTTIDALPDTVDLSALEAKALITLTALLKRLLLANPLLGGAGILLIGLLPMAFSALPKTLDAAAYKGRLKEEVAKVIGEAKITGEAKL